MDASVAGGAAARVEDFQAQRRDAGWWDRTTVYNRIQGGAEGFEKEFGTSVDGIIEALKLLPQEQAVAFAAAIQTGGLSAFDPGSPARLQEQGVYGRYGVAPWRQSAAVEDPLVEMGSRLITNVVTPLSSAADVFNRAADKIAIAADRFYTAQPLIYGNIDTVRTPGPAVGPGSSDMTAFGRASKKAIGGHGTVYGPTLFMAGEAGIEDYEFTPARNRKAKGKSSSGGVSVGPFYITEAGDAKQTAAYIVRELEKALGNG